ncbi:uroporphyrin-3 C-methyltransferase [Marinimicrobium koreense]|uniref:Uroporphyrin-3 C-methyltransferase n=2 Tax=Marinimicrobium TaxID=359337 RepID=A0A3N1P181_9GAMM|nr:uroporphyrinogen-III C-methyltransferase [Marinimicrobium koreense]ROQ21789.1 uroporphyrin-3 C-methyltransferase [Marinimicrobium koreense]
MTDNDQTNDTTQESTPPADKTPADTTSDRADKGTPKRPSKKTPANKSGRARRWGWLLLVLICVGLPLAAGYGVWWAWQDLEQQREQLTALQQRLAEQSQALRQQDRTLDQLPGQLSSDLRADVQSAQRGQAEIISQMEQRLNRVDRRLSAIASTDREDWKLAEAEYLLRLANQRLVLERDSRNALALAETTDAILRDLGDADLLPIRRALARDIQALKLADQVDREGLYLRLLALNEQVPTLPLVEPMRSTPDNTVPDEASAEANTGPWATIKQSFARLVERISGHIRIRHHDQPIAALADPREQFILRQQLQLMLEQAQAALLREQTELYQSSLTRAADWLEQHYALNPQTESALSSLRELAAVDIAPELPDLNDALKLLEVHIEQQHRLSPDFQRAPGEESDS